MKATLKDVPIYAMILKELVRKSKSGVSRLFFSNHPHL